MSSYFPFINPHLEIEKSNEFPLYREIAWDFKKNQPIIENGEFKIVEGIDAIKVWCYLTLLTPRYQYPIYSWDYGSEIKNLIGMPYTRSLTESECERLIKQCLLINPYILEVNIISASFIDSILSTNVKIITIYGDGEVNI